LAATAPESEGGAGLSQRQAAKLLGVSEGTVRNDVRNDYAENAQELRNPTDEKRAEIETKNGDWHMCR
jgi:transposase